MAKKRTFINSDEELIVKGSLIVQGEFIQKDTTVVQNETAFQGDTLVINADGVEGPGGPGSTATLQLNSRDSEGELFTSTIKFDASQPDRLQFDSIIEAELAIPPGSSLTLDNLAQLDVQDGSARFTNGGNVYTGVAEQATSLEENITIQVQGDATGITQFRNSNQTANLALTLSDVLTPITDAGTWGTTSESITLTVNSKGQITAIEQNDIAITASQVTDFTNSIDAHLSGQDGIDYNTGNIQVDTSVLRTQWVDSGLTYTSGNLSVDTDVVRTFLDQTISGEKTITDELTLQSDVIFTNNTNLLPSLDNTVSLGSPTVHLANVFTDTATVRNFSLGSNAEQTVRELFSGQDGINFVNTTGEFEVDNTVLRTQWVDDGLTYANGSLNVDSTVVRTSGSQIIAGEKTLANAATFQAQVTLNDNLEVQGDSVFQGNVRLDSDVTFQNNINLVPALDSTVTLGAPDKFLGNLYVDFANIRNITFESGNNSGILEMFSGQDGINYDNTSGEIEVDNTVLRTQWVDDGLTYASGNLSVDSTVVRTQWVDDGLTYASGNLSVDNTVIRTGSSGVPLDQTMYGTLSITGDLDIGGVINSRTQEDLFVEDNRIFLNKGGTDQDAHILVDQPGVTIDPEDPANTAWTQLPALKWSAADSEWQFTNNGSDYFPLQKFPDLTGGNAIELTSAGVINAQAGAGITVTTSAIELTPSGVTAATYGSASEVGSYQVDQYGRIVSAQDIQIDITASQVNNFTSSARDTISVTSTGPGSVAYNSATGVITYTGISQAEANVLIDGRLTAGAGLTYDASGTFAVGAGNGIIANAANIEIDYSAFSAGDGIIHDAQGEFSFNFNRLSGSTGIDYNNGEFTLDPESLVNGDGMARSGYTLNVDSTVVRTSDDQNIAGVKQFTDRLVLPNQASIQDGSIYYTPDGFYGYLNGLQIPFSPQTDVGTVITAPDAEGTGIPVFAGEVRQQISPDVETVDYNIRALLGGTHIDLAESSNVITIAANVSGIQGEFSASTVGNLGSLAYNNGVFTLTTPTTSQIRSQISATGLVNYNATTGVISTDADQYTSWSVETNSGTGDRTAINSGNTLQILGGANITVTNSGNVITIQNDNQADITGVNAGTGMTGGGDEGTVTLNVIGGNGIIANPGNIEIDYSAFSAGTGVSYNNLGEFSIGQNVDPGATVNFVRIQGLNPPEQNSDAVNKEYADNLALGLQARTRADVLVDFNLAATYDNGPENDGVGSTLTMNTNGPAPDIDGVPGSELNEMGSRFILNGQTNAAHNGLYVTEQSGDATQPWILRRCVECDEAFEIPGSFVFIRTGDTYGGTGWTAVVDDPATFVVGTDDIEWNQFSGAGTYTAGQGLELLNTEFNVSLSTGLDFSGDAIRLAPTVAGAGLSHTSGVLNIGAGAGITVNAANVALSPTTVTTGSYGSANSVTTFTVDQYGRLTDADTNTINITSAQVSNFTSSTRGAISAAASGPGNLSYNSSTGVITYTGISQSEANTLIDARISGGAGLTYSSGVLAVGSGAGITVNAANVALTATAVTTGSYGNASTVPNFTVDQYGRLTQAGQNSINIAASQIGSGTIAYTRLPDIRFADLASSAYLTSSDSFSNSNSLLMTAAAIDGRIQSYGYSTTTGTITGVSAGNGLTGGGSSGSVTLNVGAGDGITVNAGNVQVNSTVVRTTRTISTSGIATGGGNLGSNLTISVPGTNLAMGGSGDSRTITSSTGNNVTVPVASTTDAGFMAFGDKTKLDGIAAGAEVNVATNLGYTASTRLLTSSTGTNVTLPQVTTTNDGLMIAADKTKLNGIAAGAEVNVATNLGSSGTGATRTITSSTGTNTSITYSAADLNATPTSRTITAGNGLTGGGDLTNNRTITMGTPETVTTSSTNDVSATGHSHALTLPASATRGEISTANITNATSGTLGFISGRRMNDALTNYGDPFNSSGTYNNLQAGNVQNILTPGNYISGGNYNGSVARTFNVNATSANTASTVVARDGSGNFSAGIISGTATQARYADLAERYAIDQPEKPGTVVVFGGDAEVTAASKQADHRVAGVVSTDPAYLMNSEAGDDQTHPAIALTGRVPVYVTGKVEPGDLLVTSSVPGHAQTDNDARPGRILGKAIGSNESGEAVIEVLITLM